VLAIFFETLADVGIDWPLVLHWSYPPSASIGFEARRAR
jgi:hypothetical protein